MEIVLNIVKYGFVLVLFGEAVIIGRSLAELARVKAQPAVDATATME